MHTILSSFKWLLVHAGRSEMFCASTPTTGVIAVPVQELGRFPDLGSFDMESVPAYGDVEQVPSSSERHADGSMHSGKSSRQASSRPDATPFVTQPKKPLETVADETVEEADAPAEEDAEATAVQQEAEGDGEKQGKEEAAGKEEGSPDGKLSQSNDHNIAHLSDAGSDDGAAAAREQLGASSTMVRGGESLSSTVAPGAPSCCPESSHVALTKHLSRRSSLCQHTAAVSASRDEVGLSCLVLPRMHLCSVACAHLASPRCRAHLQCNVCQSTAASMQTRIVGARRGPVRRSGR